MKSGLDPFPNVRSVPTLILKPVVLTVSLFAAELNLNTTLTFVLSLSLPVCHKSWDMLGYEEANGWIHHDVALSQEKKAQQ